MDNDNPLKIASEITQFNDIVDFMQDEHLDKALHLVLKLLMKPDVPPAMAPRLIVELQALSTKFAIESVRYATIKRDKAGTDNNFKKNIYYSLKEALDKLVDALKYSARYGLGN